PRGAARLATAQTDRYREGPGTPRPVSSRQACTTVRAVRLNTQRRRAKGAAEMSATQGARTLIRVPRVWDGTGAETMRDVALEIVDGRIGRIGADLTPAEGARVLTF